MRLGTLLHGSLRLQSELFLWCPGMLKGGSAHTLAMAWLVSMHNLAPASGSHHTLHPRKSSEEAMRERQQVVSLAAMREPSLLRFYVSREWLNKFNTFAEPGPITNHTFLCSHGGEQSVPGTDMGWEWSWGGWATPQLPPVLLFTGIPPNKYHYIDDLVVILPQSVWEHLYSRQVLGALWAAAGQHSSCPAFSESQ